MAEKVIMLGNEAIARGAYEAGVKVSSAYPGTPSTEISEYLVQYRNDVYEGMGAKREGGDRGCRRRQPGRSAGNGVYEARGTECGGRSAVFCILYGCKPGRSCHCSGR